jgi:hypothetical protein
VFTAFAVAAALVIGLTHHARAATSPEATPSPSPHVAPASGAQSASLETNFGGSRSRRTLSLLLEASGDGSNVRAALTGDLARADAAEQFPTSNITITLRPLSSAGGGTNSRALVRLDVAIDPNGVAAGVYSGTIRVDQDGSDPALIPLKVSLRDGGWLWVVLLIFVGAGLGMFAKWLSDAGAALSDASRLYDRIYVQTKDLEINLPAGFKTQLELARLALAQLDDTNATAVLGDISKQLPLVLQVAQLIADLRSEVSRQADLAPTSGLANAADVVALAQSHLDDALQLGWPIQPADADQLKAELGYFRGLTAIFREYPNADPNRKNVLARAFNLYAADNFQGGSAALSQAAPLAAAAGAPKAGGRVIDIKDIGGSAHRIAAAVSVATGGVVDRIGNSVKVFVVRHQRSLTAGFIAAATALAGVQLLYFANPAFGASAADWLVVLGWGFGAQLAGLTLSQLGTSLYGRGPKLA